jgi:tight adherence protein C
MDTEKFFGFQVYMLIVGFIFGGFFTAFGLFLGGCGGPIPLLILPTAGFFYPRLWLNQKAKQRQEAINLGMPDFLDMLVISVQAGMGFDSAMRLVTSHITGPLNEEIKRLVRELDVGEPKDQAFRRLVKRNTSEDLRIFVDALLQAEELGTSITKTLENQAAELRQRRINRAKERAARASPNISLITVFIIVPSVLCLFMSMMVLVIVIGRDIGSLSPG